VGQRSRLDYPIWDSNTSTTWTGDSGGTGEDSILVKMPANAYYVIFSVTPKGSGVAQVWIRNYSFGDTAYGHSIEDFGGNEGSDFGWSTEQGEQFWITKTAPQEVSITVFFNGPAAAVTFTTP
jgi:hypothetical protein